MSAGVHVKHWDQAWSEIYLKANLKSYSWQQKQQRVVISLPLLCPGKIGQHYFLSCAAFPPSRYQRKVLEIASGMLSRFASIFADGQLDLSQDFNARATDPSSSSMSCYYGIFSACKSQRCRDMRRTICLLNLFNLLVILPRIGIAPIGKNKL